MTLVNDTDAKRENIDEYLKELETMSDEQLSLLSTLREVRACDHSCTRVFQNEKPNPHFTPSPQSLVSYNASKKANDDGSTAQNDYTIDFDDDTFDLGD